MDTRFDLPAARPPARSPLAQPPATRPARAMSAMGRDRLVTSAQKPPIQKQLIRHGDPTAGTYGASGAVWLTGGPVANLERALGEAKDRHQTPVVVQYAIPGRDKGGGSAGGAASVASYLAGVEKNAKAIGGAPAVIIIEPDALALGLDPNTVKSAVAIFKANCPNARLYIDAGNSGWRGANGIAKKLMEAGIAQADGFSLNVSAFRWTNESTAYGDKVVAALAKRDPALAGKQFVVDTGRNGNGPGVDEHGWGTWGDPVRAKNGGPIMNGPLPTTDTQDPHAAAFLWVKPPGWGDLRTRGLTFGGKAWVTPNATPPLGPR